MVMLNFKGRDFFMNDTLFLNLQVYRNNLYKQDESVMIIMTGKPGLGKSTLAQHAAVVMGEYNMVDGKVMCKSKFDLPDICFTIEDAKRRLMQAKKGDTIILDESIVMLHSKSSMARAQRRLTEMLNQVRQLNICVVLCIPSFWDLQRSVGLYLSHCLINVYKQKKTGRKGMFAFFNDSTKKKLYLKGAQMLNDWAQKPNFTGTFPKGYCVDDEQYRVKKLEALRSDTVEPRSRYKVQRNVLVYLLRQEGYTQQQIADRFNKLTNETLSRKAISDILIDFKLNLANSPREMDLRAVGSGENNYKLFNGRGAPIG